jgi:thiamine phosphate synthase YjbQ (UPF0047 family)
MRSWVLACNLGNLNAGSWQDVDFSAHNVSRTDTRIHMQATRKINLLS